MIINLFAGPGCGKSTLALGLGYVLKARGHEAAVITEEAKPFALVGAPIGPAEQLEIMYYQYKRESAYYDLADFIITDSPLELGGYYHWLRSCGCNAYWNVVEDLRVGAPPQMNFFLPRLKPYQQRGRYQNEEEARKADVQIREQLEQHGIKLIDAKTHDPSTFADRYLGV